MVLSISPGEIKSASVEEVAAQSGAPTKIQLRIVSIDLSGQLGLIRVASVWLVSIANKPVIQFGGVRVSRNDRSVLE